uniref:monooxygenase n=1 Tax=Escherichia coli TaxID=562 RepID=UPI00203E6092
MATLLQLHFAFNGPFGDAMAEQLKPLAESINQEPGFLWKVWTESEKNHEAGGIYLFTDEKSALAYLEKLNRPGFPGEYFICELRLPDHRFRWKH